MHRKASGLGAAGLSGSKEISMSSQAVGGTKEHPITMTAARGSTRVTWKSAVIADSGGALDLKEANYPIVKYIPRADADMAKLRRTSHSTHCPYKGNASYFSVVVNGQISENAVWSYEEPLPGMEAIKDHLAFYPNRVDAIETSE
jgi:uncharacterized protein (DUF427 family)